MLKLAGVIILGYFILKFIWNTVSGIFKLVVGVIIIAIAIYFVNPTILHDVFGKENVENVATKAINQTNETIDDAKEYVEEKATEVVKEKVNSLINK